MKPIKLVFIIVALYTLRYTAVAQENEFTPHLCMVEDALNWTVVNRFVTYDEHLHLDAKPGDGLLYINDFEFGNGKIEVDIQGKNTPGRSFVGFAFHILNDSTFDAVYFRPFNFQNSDRNKHSAQYISMPQNNWSALRKAYPGKYENAIHPVPNPDGWFHATIIINHPVVKVYVNNSEEASLTINQISSRKKRMVGILGW